MRKFFTLIFLICGLNMVQAQKSKVITASTLQSQGSIAEAKTAIDEAFSDPEVSEMARAWLTKGEVYIDIFKFQIGGELSVVNPVEVADEAFRKAYSLDMAAEKKPGRYLDRVQAGMYTTSIGYFEIAADQFNDGAYEASMMNFEKSYDAVVYMEEKELGTEANSGDLQQLKADALTNAALCALNLQDYDKAAGFYSEMIDLGVADERTYANLASIYIVQSEYEKAKPVIDEGRVQYPDNESLIESELNYFIGTDQSDKAIDKLIVAVESNPDDPDIYFNLALAYDKLGEEEKMIGAYEKIIEIDPEYEGAYLNLGAFYNEKANDVIKAMNEMEDWREAVKLEPERDKWYNQALPYLENAYGLMQDDPNVEGVKRALERIYANLNMLDKVKELQGE